MRWRRLARVLSAALALQLSAASLAPRARAEEGARAAAAERRAPREVTLHDVLTVAIRQNPALASASIDVAIADAELRGTAGLDDVVLDGSLKSIVTRNEAIPDQVFQQLELDELGLTTRVRKPLRGGGDVSLRLDATYRRTVTRLDTGDVRHESESEIFAPSVGLVFFQPLLEGRGRDVARSEVRRAAVAKDAALLDREARAAEVVRAVVRAYWELAYAARELEIQRNALALAREQLRVVELEIASGALPPIASAEVELAVANREEDELIAEGLLYERALDLRRLVGLEAGPGEIALVPIDAPAAPARELDLDEAVSRAISSSASLRALRARGRGAALEVELAEDALRPRLDLTVSARAAGNAADPTDSFAQLAAYGGLSVEAGVVFSVPLGRRAERAVADAARQRVRKARVGEQELTAALTVDVTRAVHALRLAMKRVEVHGRSVDLARMNVVAESKRFEAGEATSTDVLRRQNELTEAELRGARAVIDALEAEADLDALTGDLLDRYRITLGESR